jgi:type IV pilus assembly protein PilM
LTFEVGAGESVDDAIVRECRKLLSFPLEKAVIDYPCLDDISSDGQRRLRTNIIAAHRDQVDRYIRLLKTAGLSAEAIDFDLLALLRLHRYLFSINEGPVIFCNIGFQRSLMAVVTRDSVMAQRNTHWGIQGLLDRLETNFELSGSREQAAAMLSKYGLGYESLIEPSAGAPAGKSGEADEDQGIYRTVFQILTPYMDVLIHEFFQTTGYVRSELQSARFDELFLYGRAGTINFLEQYLEKRVNMPVTTINPMLKMTLSDGSTLPDPEKGAPFALALGLAMRKVPWL